MNVDLPCIISGGTFAVLDPHKVNINCKDDDGVPLTGTAMSVAELCSSSSLSSCYNGLFGFQKLPLNNYYKGTIFRFPLRTPQANSKLSETVYSCKKIIQDLFQSLRKEAAMLLLFLKNLTKISLYKYNQRDQSSKLLLDISLDDGRIQSERDKCIELARNWKERESGTILLHSLSVSVRDEFEGTVRMDKCTYLVLNSIGTSDADLRSQAEQLQIIPWVGIAAPCSFSTAVENCEMSVLGTKVDVEGLINNFPSLSKLDWRYIDPVVSGHTFCFLPLPNPTGLPVSINGYFSIADNRRSIKWPMHDEHGKGADFNRGLVMKMVSYAYAVMITCRCQLVSYVNTPSYLSTELSDAYGIWPLMSQVKNHPIWSYLVDPVVKLLIDQKVVWTAAEGGKWVKFSDAYYQPEDSSIPNAVIDLLLEIEMPFIILPAVILDSIRTVQSLVDIVKSREITPDLMRRIMKQFQFMPRTILYQTKCVDILSFILSDFTDDSSINCLLGINIMPLMNKTASPKLLSTRHSAEMLYILPNDKCVLFLYGINTHIITNNLPNEVVIKLIQLSQITNVNIKLADDEVVCKELLPLSLRQWQVSLHEQFTWYPGQGNHPPLKWIFYLWKWLANIDINLVWNYPIVPQDRLSSSKDIVKIVHLLSLSKCHGTSLTLSTDASKMDNKVADLLKTLGVTTINKSAGVFQSSGLYDNLLHLTPYNVITLLTNNARCFRIGNMQQWRPNDKEMFFQYLSAAGNTLKLSFTEVKLVKELPIFWVGISKQDFATLRSRSCFIVQQPFGLRIDNANVVYPDNVFYCAAEEADFLRTLGCSKLTFYDYCTKHFLPFCAKQNSMQTKKNYRWILSCGSLWCDNLIKYLKSVPLVTTANTHKLVKSCNLYDPNDPAISQLFSDNEDELPSREYQQFLPQLRKLGLMTWNVIISNSQMYEQLLINCAQSLKTVLHKNGTDFTMKRSFAIVTCLVDYFTKYNPSYAFQNDIRSVKFLFCAIKPTPAYPMGLKWDGLNGSKDVFACNQLYCSENGLLVGSTSKVLSQKYLNFISCKEFQNLFQVPNMITVINQLNLLIACEPTNAFPTSVYAIYDYFINNLEEFKIHHDRLNSKWIWIGNQKRFEEASKFAMQPFSGKQLEPFCYAITQAPQLLKYGQMFSAYGIPNVFPEDTMLNVISQLQKCKNQLSATHLDVVFAILDWVHETNRESGEVPDNVLIPTNDCQLLPPGKCIFDDRGWSRNPQKIRNQSVVIHLLIDDFHWIQQHSLVLNYSVSIYYYRLI